LLRRLVVSASTSDGGPPPFLRQGKPEGGTYNALIVTIIVSGRRAQVES
jgi:hypothetical protein